MGKYDSQAATALRILTKKGGLITIERERPASMDPVTRREVPADATTRTFACLKLPAGSSLALVPQTLREKIEVELHLSQQGVRDFEPAPGDVAVVGAVRYRILWSRTYDPASDGAVYTLAYGAR